MDVVFDNLDRYGEAFRTTVTLTLVAFAVAFVLGTVVAACRVSPVPPLRWAAATFVELVRNTPLTVLFVLVYFGLPKAGITFEAFPASVLVLGGYTGAFVAESVRSGINTVATGQAEAARAIGLTFPQVLGLIVLPQALRTVVAPLGNLFIACTKNSAIASVISLNELSKLADGLSNETGRPVEVLIGVAAAYLIVTLPSGFALGWLERKVAIRR